MLSCLPSSFFQISPNWGLATMQSVLASVKIYRSIDVEIHRSFSIKLAVLLNGEQQKRNWKLMAKPYTMYYGV